MDENIKNQEAITEQQPLMDKRLSGKPKLSKKKLIILISAIVAVIAAVIIICAIPSRFERVKNEAAKIAGEISSRGDDNFTIDTYPYEDTNMSSAQIAMLAPETQSKALAAIKYVNEELGFNGSLYDRMLQTNALMGRQSEENDKYRVSWTYHPDEGLEVTYEKK